MSAITKREWGLGIVFCLFAFLLTIMGNYVWWMGVEYNIPHIYGIVATFVSLVILLLLLVTMLKAEE